MKFKYLCLALVLAMASCGSNTNSKNAEEVEENIVVIDSKSYTAEDIKKEMLRTWIAYKEYGDPNHWRHIAQANGITNPMALRPGQVLNIVPLP